MGYNTESWSKGPNIFRNVFVGYCGISAIKNLGLVLNSDGNYHKSFGIPFPENLTTKGVYQKNIDTFWYISLANKKSFMLSLNVSDFLVRSVQPKCLRQYRVMTTAQT